MSIVYATVLHIIYNKFLYNLKHVHSEKSKMITFLWPTPTQLENNAGHRGSKKTFINFCNFYCNPMTHWYHVVDTGSY